MMELRAIEAEFRARMHKALAFDGVDNYVVVSHSDVLMPTTAITVLAWVYPKRFVRGLQGIVTKHKGGITGYRLMLENDTFEWAIYNNNATYDEMNSSSIEINKWYCVAGVFDNGYQAIFLNGKLDKEREATVSSIAPNTYNLEIGRNRATALDYIYALIGSIYIYYDIALSKSEIKHLYHNPFDPPEIEHLGLWLAPAGIDTANGKWWDLSGRNNHGTIYGCNEVLLTEPEVVVV